MSRLRRSTPGHGFTLVELLVAVVIGMVVTLAASGIIIRGENTRRVSTSANDIGQTGAYISYQLDRSLRSAGSSFVQSWRSTFGCQLRVSLSAATILPRANAFPAPFASLPQTVRLAPVVIHAGAGAGGSDVLQVMAGNAGFGEAPASVLAGSITSTEVRLRNTLGLRGNDLVLLVEDGMGCMVQQVDSAFVGSVAQQLPFAGSYYAATVDGVALSSLGAANPVTSMALGNAAGANPPHFMFYGVGANDTLFGYDLLRMASGDTPVPMAEGVTDMRALYGVDTNDDGAIDSWVDATAAPWNVASLLDGSAAARTNLRRILAVRVGLVLRSSLVEKADVAPASLTLFEDLAGAAVTHDVAVGDRVRRHRTFEFTVPLRNLLLLPNV